MEEFQIVIGSDVHYTYQEDDRMISRHPSQSQSAVYRAVSNERGRFGEGKAFVVKKFRVETGGPVVVPKDLLLRWKALTRLKQDNIVSYHKISIKMIPSGPMSGTGNIETDFVMNYCDGPSLEAMISDRDQPLPMKTVFDLSKQVANGLAYLHKNNISHGDLSPKSILVVKTSDSCLRFRLCALDNYTPFYSRHFAARYFDTHGYCCMAPEVLAYNMKVSGDCICRIVDDPRYYLLHVNHKKFCIDLSGLDVIKDSVADYSMFFQQAIRLFAVYCVTNRQDYLDTIWQFLRASPVLAEDGSTNFPFYKLLCGLVEFSCTMDVEAAKHFAFAVHRLPVDKWPALEQGTEQSYCEMVQADTGADVTGPEPRATSVSASAPYCWYRPAHLAPDFTSATCSCTSNFGGPEDHKDSVFTSKADIWSLGGIMQLLTGDACVPDMFGPIIRNTARVTEIVSKVSKEHFRLGMFGYFHPKDFWDIIEACCRRAPDKRITAEELLNKLVILGVDAYGDTWMNIPAEDMPVVDELSGSECPMVEEFGCTCEYSYENKDFIGQGSYGIVFKATVYANGTYQGNKTVAVKEYTKCISIIKQMQQDNSWKRQKEQWQTMVELKHKHLVTCHRITIRKLTDGVCIAFMMDYCEGGDLEAYLTRCNPCGTGVCPLSVETIVNYAAQVASGLQYFHQHQFIHGDLKPGNVFVSTAPGDSTNFTLRIGDLDGAVRIRDTSITTASEKKNLTGTAPYMAPEMIMLSLQQEHDDISYLTDVWSLGCVILDLANHSVGIKERIFHKNLSNEDGILVPHQIQRNDFSSANAFVFKLSQGYYPYIADVIPEELKSLIQPCLMPGSKERATTTRVLEKLNMLEEKMLHNNVSTV